MERIGNKVALLSMLVLVGGAIATSPVQAAQRGKQRTALQALLQEELKKRSSLETIIGNLTTLAQQTHQAGNIEATDKIEDVIGVLTTLKSLVQWVHNPYESEDYQARVLNNEMRDQAKKKLDDEQKKAQQNGQVELAKIIKKAKEGKLK